MSETNFIKNHYYKFAKKILSISRKLIVTLRNIKTIKNFKFQIFVR